eukprot:SAG31_NODE_1518_length_8029_cov_43.028247_3_plen_185_part_00
MRPQARSSLVPAGGGWKALLTRTASHEPISRFLGAGSAAFVMATTARLWSRLRAAQAKQVTPHTINSGQGAHLQIDGKWYLNFCSSHYLGFAVNPRLKQAAQAAIELHGLGTGYRTLSGTHALHVELEKAIAEFKGTEAAVCFTSAYAANASAVQTLLTKGPVLSPHPTAFPEAIGATVDFRAC